jgi:hypothetical protein
MIFNDIFFKEKSLGLDIFLKTTSKAMSARTQSTDLIIHSALELK